MTKSRARIGRINQIVLSSKMIRVKEMVVIHGWLSLCVEDPQAVAAWYERFGFDIVGGRPDIGSIVVGTKDCGWIMVLLPGEKIEHPDRLQIHFAVPDVDAAYDRFIKAGVKFHEPPRDMPWRWRHADTTDPAGHTVALASPLPNATDLDSALIRGDGKLCGSV